MNKTTNILSDNSSGNSSGNANNDLKSLKKKFNLQPLDFSEILNIGISFGSFYQEQLKIKTERRYQEGLFEVYQSQRDLNQEIKVFNFNQRLQAASRQASSVKSAFAAVGLSGGTLADDVNNYQKNLVVNAMSD